MTKHYNIMPARECFATDVQQVISRIPFLTCSVNSSMVYLYEEDFLKKSVRLCFELRESVSLIELELIHSDIASRIITELRNLNRDFAVVLGNLTDSQESAISFYGLGEGPFKPAASLAKSKISVKLNY